MNSSAPIKLNVLVQPNAKKNEIVGYLEEDHIACLKIKVEAPAIDGKANQELIDFLADICCVSKKNIEIVSGNNGRRKVLAFYNLKCLPAILHKSVKL